MPPPPEGYATALVARVCANFVRLVGGKAAAALIVLLGIAGAGWYALVQDATASALLTILALRRTREPVARVPVT